MADEFDVLLTDVTKRFGESVAVDNITLGVRRGEFFSLLGPSGCGKTTTLRMIAGFEFPSAGDVRICGRVVNDVPAFRRETNLVFQQLALFPHLDVFDNIAFGLRIKKLSKSEIRDRVGHMLEVVQLEGYDNRRIGQLSGGQQQRVAIARALVNEPAVLLLDEPLGALDLKLRLQMQSELKALQHRLGTTFIYVTHDQGEALTMSDRIAVMNRGRIEQIGRSSEIYARPETTFVASFIGETNLLNGRVERSDAVSALVDTEGLRVRVATDRATRTGDRTKLSIRPELIELGEATSAENGSHENVFRLKVSDVTFLGTTIRYIVTLPSGRQLEVRRLAGDQRVFAVGDDVVVSWRDDSVILFREDEDSGSVEGAV